LCHNSPYRIAQINARQPGVPPKYSGEAVRAALKKEGYAEKEKEEHYRTY